MYGVSDGRGVELGLILKCFITFLKEMENGNENHWKQSSKEFFFGSFKQLDWKSVEVGGG